MRKTTLKEKVANQIKSLKFQFRDVKNTDTFYTLIIEKMIEKYIKDYKTFPIEKKSYKKASVIAFNIDKRIKF